jgi:hypothetical protein
VLLSPCCSECNRLAAEIELSETSGTWHLKYSGPGGSSGIGRGISVKEADAILLAFTPPYDPEKIKTAGFYDDAGFCTECAKFYCSTHWNVSSTGGGRCLAGHFKSLDPHWSPEWED